jgi:predicted PurR-regulated permease PerM
MNAPKQTCIAGLSSPASFTKLRRHRDSPSMCCCVQQVENWVPIPIIETWAVELPPVLAILSLVIFGLLFGVPGVIVGAPLMIVVMILVQKLYIDGMLEDKA